MPSLHRNRAALRELIAQANANRPSAAATNECDREEEILLARFQDLKDLPYQAPATPSSNGFTFSNEEIAAAATCQRLMEGASHMLNNLPPYAKFGIGADGTRDLFAEMPHREPPMCIGPKIHGISPESIALRRMSHPDEFTKRRRLPRIFFHLCSSVATRFSPRAFACPNTVSKPQMVFW